MYFSDDITKDAVAIRTANENEVHKSNPKATMLRPNLIFGDYSYFLRYLEQSVIAGKVPKSLVSHKDLTNYHPVHYDDLFAVIKRCLTDDTTKG